MGGGWWAVGDGAGATLSRGGRRTEKAREG